MRFEKYLTFWGHPEGDEKSGGGFRSAGKNTGSLSINSGSSGFLRTRIKYLSSFLKATQTAF
jgi:hypothetical protein